MLLRILVAAACGVLFTAAFPPTGFWPLALALAPFFGLVAASERLREAFWLGFGFAIGFFSLYVLWLPRSFSELLTPFFWVIFPLMLIALGVYWGGTAWLARLIAGRGRGVLWLLPLLWVLIEWVRTQGLLGFPWGTIGYLWLDSPVAQLADTLGVYGLGLLTTVAMALLAAPFVPSRRDARSGSSSLAARALAPALALVLLGGGWGIGLLKLGQPLPETDRTALLVQGDVDPFGRAAGTVQEVGIHVGLSQNGVADLIDPPDLVVWPEGVVNTFGNPLEGAQGQPNRDRIQGSSPGSAFVIGGSVFEQGRRFNSVFSLDDGQLVDRYDKRFLVPFGERFPLIETAAPLYRAVFNMLGLPMLLGTFPGDDLAPLDTPDGPVAAYICYESVFPQVQRAMVARGAELLINITNDAWFARGDGGRQHFDMGRLRAIETRRYLLRAGNDGITGAVDPNGRVTAELERRVAGTLLVPYAMSDVRTPYVRFGGLYLPGLAVLTLLVGLGVALRRG
jgi:apolipoprotein N-acyltransferase